MQKVIFSSFTSAQHHSTYLTLVTNVLYTKYKITHNKIYAISDTCNFSNFNFRIKDLTEDFSATAFFYYVFALSNYQVQNHNMLKM